MKTSWKYKFCLEVMPLVLYEGVLWVSGCCLMPIQQFPAIVCREQVNLQWDDDEIHFVLDQQAELDFYSASSLSQQSEGRHVAPL